MAHSISNYTIGRGIVSIAPVTVSLGVATVGSYADVGNCPKFTLTPKKEKKPHFSSRSGLKTKDLELILSAEAELKFTLDEPDVVNLARFLGDDSYSGSGIIDIRFASQLVAVKFVGTNTQGLAYEWIFESVTLDPSDSIDLIGDDFQVVPFTGQVLADDSGSFGTSDPIVVTA